MVVLCGRFGVSRKTGYKILERHSSCGLEMLTDRSRRSYRHANQLPMQIEMLIARRTQARPRRAEGQPGQKRIAGGAMRARL
jgi:putative transposase